MINDQKGMMTLHIKYIPYILKPDFIKQTNQSLLLGPLYFPVAGIPSIIWGMVKNEKHLRRMPNV